MSLSALDFDLDKFPYSRDTLVQVYKSLVKPRLLEEKMLIQLRLGKIGKWFSGIGQEALSVGTTLAMEGDEFILPMHRNLGVFTTRGVPTDRLIGQFQAKASGFTQGRDRSFHFGSMEHKIVGMISHLGPQLSLAAGIALGSTLRAEPKATLVFTGEGATSQGEFHEALNVASVWQLPVLFVIENNGFALSTPTHEQYRCAHLADKGAGYGMESYRVAGNNVLEVLHLFTTLAQEIRKNPRPMLIECETFRMRGHEEASGVKYVPKDLLEQWALKDPVVQFEQFLLHEQILHPQDIAQIRREMQAEIDLAVRTVEREPELTVDMAKEMREVYAPRSARLDSGYILAQTQPIPLPLTQNLPNGPPSIRFLDAIRQGLEMAMEKFPNLVLMGQDIAQYGGAFKVTEGLMDRYGRERVRNTPLCESAIVGIGLGLSFQGFKAMVEMQFADFVTVGFNQIINNLAKIHYRWGQPADVVIRMPTGAGTAAGPFHSQSNEAWFTKTPGLKVVYPAFAEDAKGLLLESFEDPNPVLFFEHKVLYRSLSGIVPSEYYTIPIGKGRVVKSGTSLTIITYGMGVHWALECLLKHPQLEAELIDLRSLQPWDQEMVMESVKKTGKALILHEDTLTCGFGAEIAAQLAESCFEYLDAPILRCASLDMPIPSNNGLENEFLAKARLEETLMKLWHY